MAKKNVVTKTDEPSQVIGSQISITTQEDRFQSPIPSPEVIKNYEILVPGTAKRLIDLAIEESLHRRTIESNTNQANISAQRKQGEIASYQTRAVFRSDLLGQVAGTIVSLSCIGGAVYLGLQNHEVAAAALCAIPLAAVIQALRGRKAAERRQDK
ncbi:MAG: DUF2335 domain-containing protein [Burkholderiaceae bacterium]|nr:DUF2335 domain-containing protein [Burkholderiaceae bacterium]